MTWPGLWHSKVEQNSNKGVSFTNDNGILCLTGERGGEYLFIEDFPKRLENKC